MTIKNPTLRRRTEELCGKVDNWQEAYGIGVELVDLGVLIVAMSKHIRDLQSKVDSQAEHIKGLNKKLEGET